MRACRFVPEPETRTVPRMGAVECVGVEVLEVEEVEVEVGGAVG